MTPASEERRIACGAGQVTGEVYVRRWLPAAPAVIPGTNERAPVVLFHDSLGRVALWRKFPQALAHASRRTVIAYDRLGFGQSSPRSGPLDHSYRRSIRW